jgi:large subunit ribosomal protein L22
MEAVAKTKYLKGSPRKARLVIDLIRGTNVSRALSILRFTDKRAAAPIAQCLNSAIANATYKAEQDNIAIDPDDLWIKTCFVDMGPTKGRRRMRPAPQGRAYREQRHYCHITIQVTSDERRKSEEETRLEAERAERIAARKAENAKKKAAAPKKEKKAKKADETVPTPVEPTAQAMNEAAENLAGEETPMEVATVEEAKADAEVSAAHDAETHTAAEENAETPADDAQENINEELERQ